MYQSPAFDAAMNKANEEASLNGVYEDEAEVEAAAYHMQQEEEGEGEGWEAYDDEDEDATTATDPASKRKRRRIRQHASPPPPPPPFLASAHPYLFPLPRPRPSPPRAPSPSSLQPSFPELNTRRTAQLLQDAERDHEVEEARRAPLTLEGASQSSATSSDANSPFFSSPHGGAHRQRPSGLSEGTGTTTVEDRFAEANRRLLQTPSLLPFADGETPASSSMPMHNHHHHEEEEEAAGEDAHHLLPLPQHDAQGQEQGDDTPRRQQQQQQLSRRTRLRKWQSAFGTGPQHRQGGGLVGADERLARAAARRVSAEAVVDDGAGTGGVEGWEGMAMQGQAGKEDVEEFGESAAAQE